MSDRNHTNLGHFQFENKSNYNKPVHNSHLLQFKWQQYKGGGLTIRAAPLTIRAAPLTIRAAPLTIRAAPLTIDKMCSAICKSRPLTIRVQQYYFKHRKFCKSISLAKSANKYVANISPYIQFFEFLVLKKSIIC